ncbi:sulfatase-like hydrolase/transferase [Chloroflexota bacterium]
MTEKFHTLTSGWDSDYLRELNILDDTVLIITSDHGDNFGEHHLMGHILCVYDTLLHVPLIIRYPGLFEAGLRVNHQVQLTDVYPTILDIVAPDRIVMNTFKGTAYSRRRKGAS